MPSPQDVTFVIPVFNLKSNRLKNLKFIIPYIKKTGCRILVVEQIDKDVSDLSEFISKFEGVEHILFKTSEKRLHKTGIINYAVFNHVTTKYVWVNDVDFYMRFDRVFEMEWTSNFIQPYEIAKKLNDEHSKMILAGKKLDVDFADRSVRYISLYGALSFIFEVNDFISIGAMDESIYGWGYEDVELARRVGDSRVIQKIELRGIHLWHPMSIVAAKQESMVEKPQDLAVVTCHFNWGGFINPIRNLHRFINQMQLDEIPLFGVELSLTGNFETSGMDGWMQIEVSKENVFFQKEACINLAVEKLVPKKYTKIAWIDSDLHFTNKNWYTDASEKLNEYKVIQLYSHGIKTDRYGRFLSKEPSAIFSYTNIPPEKRRDWILSAGEIGYPGGAMAARRELWEHGGLYPYRILGGGDTAFVMAMLKYKIGWPTNELFIERHNNWKRKIFEYVGENVTYIEGDFIHEWHGDAVDRRYADRYSILKNVNVIHIQLNDDGIVHNYGNRNINDAVLEYFKNRNEDGDGKVDTKKSPRRVVYTCITGNYDALREVVNPDKGVDYICFSDDISESQTWKIKPIPKCLKYLDTTKIARCMKILPHLFLSEYDISVWVDGNIQVVGNINQFIDKNLLNYFAIPKHPDRICVYDEANAVINLGKDNVDIVNSQIMEYMGKNYPENNGMVQSGIMIRKHNDKRCIAISNLWWNEVRQFSKRDQLSFNYSIWKKNVTIDILNPNIIVSEYFQIWAHPKKGGGKVSLRKNYGNMKNYVNGVEV
jgi:hypothetical protein